MGIVRYLLVVWNKAARGGRKEGVRPLGEVRRARCAEQVRLDAEEIAPLRAGEG